MLIPTWFITWDVLLCCVFDVLFIHYCIGMSFCPISLFTSHWAPYVIEHHPLTYFPTRIIRYVMQVCMSLGRLDPCKMAVVHRLCDTDHEARLNSLNQCLWRAGWRNRPHTSTVGDENWSYLGGYAKSQINRKYCVKSWSGIVWC